MLLKKAPAYRKAEKEDFSMIREFIRRNYKDRWEFEETHTEKRLTRLFLPVKNLMAILPRFSV